MTASMKRRLEPGVVFRFLVSIVFGSAAIVLFFLNLARVKTEPHLFSKEDWRVALTRVDRDIDSAFVRNGISPDQWKKKVIPIEGAGFSRIERRLEVPAETEYLLVNMELNRLVRAHGARAIGSENSKDHLFTLHIRMGGFVIQSIIVKPQPGKNLRSQS